MFRVQRELPTFDHASVSREPRAFTNSQSTTEGNQGVVEEMHLKETPRRSHLVM